MDMFRNPVDLNGHEIEVGSNVMIVTYDPTSPFTDLDAAEGTVLGFFPARTGLDGFAIVVAVQGIRYCVPSFNVVVLNEEVYEFNNRASNS